MWWKGRRGLTQSEGDWAIAAERLSVRYRKSAPLNGVSLSVPHGCVYALLGRRGAGKSSFVRCLLGKLKPSEGRLLLFGKDAWKERRSIKHLVAEISQEAFSRDLPSAWIEAALRSERRLAVLDDPPYPLDKDPGRALEEEFRGAKGRGGATIFLTTDSPPLAELADRVGILRGGRLLLDEDIRALKTRFRRIRYRNQITETRTEYGNELDAFEAVRVRARGWGVEAVVSNYEESAFQRFRSIDGVVQAEALPMTLEEIFSALGGDKAE